MNQNEENPELDIFEIDWSSIPQKEKSDIINEHIGRGVLARRVEATSGAYLANLRSLLLSLFITLTMIILKTDNRTIVLTIIFLLFSKTILSRLIESNVLRILQLSKQNLSNSSLKKIKKYIIT